jgi:hypothetical protein
MLCNLEETKKLIGKGLTLAISGNPELLDELPRGNWIGGVTPYLMTESGGMDARDLLIVTPMPEEAKLVSIQRYGVGGLHYLPMDAPEDGFTIVIVPSSSLVHQAYAKAIPAYTEGLNKAIIGWIAGVLQAHFASRPKVYFGPIAHAIEDEAVAMHFSLPRSRRAEIKVVNLYESEGTETEAADEVSFLSEGFSVTHAAVNGKQVVFAKYLCEHRLDKMTPLLATYHGTRLSVDVKSCDIVSGHVVFFAPVFKDVTYRFSKPVKGFASRLKQEIEADARPKVFECICIRNYERLDMGKLPLGKFEGPVTYGEIAHYLTNLSIAQLIITDR